jgi:hypothetical protein
MFRQLRIVPFVAVLLLGFMSQPARADWLFTPYLGAAFGGDTPSQQITYGGSVAYLGAGVIGAEFDAGITPDFFSSNTPSIGDSNVTTVMGNLMVAVPLGEPGVRPYVSGGAGLIRSHATSVGNIFDLTNNSFGVNVGAGLIGFVAPHVGIRGDIRYFRSLQDSDQGPNVDIDLGKFDFWRATAGVTFRF